MVKLNYIVNVIRYIENNLSCFSEADKLKPETIATLHFVSLSQLYRDFYSFTGHSVKEYIRKRRISNACEKIKCSDFQLSIIAAESGCQTQQAFHKQFKSLVGMTPMEYRESDSYYYFYPFESEDLSFDVKVGAENVPNCTVLRFFDSCIEGIEDKALAELDSKTDLRIFGRNGKQQGNKFCYELMIETVGDGKAEFYATCVVDYNATDINNGWNYLYNIWLPSSMFEESGGGYFEEYIMKKGSPNKLKLYLPVRKKATENHIKIMDMPESVYLTAYENGENAEKKASEKVMTFLQKNYPQIVKQAKKFYVQSDGKHYECGIECDINIQINISNENNLRKLIIPSGRYAVLPFDCLGDISVGKEKIELWRINNGIACADYPVFAIYETMNGKFDNESITMKVCMLIDRTDN